MTTNARTRHTQFVVSWPVQGIASFRSAQSELVLSDVYWRWIFEALSRTGSDREERLEFVVAVEDGFCDASNLVETIPVTQSFMDVLQGVTPSSAPSFERVVPAKGCSMPTAEQILAEFVRLVGEAAPEGFMEMEIE